MQKHHLSAPVAFLRRHQRALILLLAFVVPTLLSTLGVMWSASAALTKPAAQTYSDPTLPPPPYDATKPTVAVLASNNGTEISDFLAPYNVFAASGAFNVYAVAPERTFTPFLWGGLDILPHYSFAELDQLLGKAPEVIVIPFFKDPENPAIVQWVRDHAGPNTLIVSICAGLHTLAATGLLDGQQATTHQMYFETIAQEFPRIQLVRGVRYIDNGNTITSAGITAGIDASLYAIQKLLGQEVALATAAKLNYAHTQFLDAPAYTLPTATLEPIAQLLNAGFVWNKQEMGVFLYEGVDEMDLSAVLDTYGRTMTARTTTFAPQRAAIRSHYGLYLIPRLTLAQAKSFDRILVPGDPTAPVQSLLAWQQSAQQPAPVYLYPAAASAGTAHPFAFDLTLQDVARRSGKLDASIAMITLEYPGDQLQLQGGAWPLQRLLPALMVGLASMAIALLWQRRQQQRRPTNARQPAAQPV